MNPLRPLAAAAATALLTLSLAACGGDDGDGGGDGGGGGGVDAADAPTDADQDEFCSLLDSQEEITTVDQARDLAEKLADIGTPADLSAEARDGYEAFVEFLGDVDEDKLAELEAAEDAETGGGETPDLQAGVDQLAELFGDDGQKVVAFLFEAGFSCVDLEDPDLGSSGTESP
ncbi:hypothetical protein GCM10023340_01380 [Nocardioides marinquilinus]|uniref:Lipoprotein n=1 Tax=Nocardioides marinquilinus TaxID=1210400 RepID=A0ABP9P6I6_9ACTN